MSATYSSRADLFGPPALLRREEAPLVSAIVTGSWRMGPARVATVDVLLSGLVISCLVRGGRVVGPMQRGESAVRFTDRALAAKAHQAAVEAARDAERRGWIA